MKQDYLIFADISADLPKAFAKEHGIRFLPMRYTVGTTDGVLTGNEEEAQIKEFYQAQRRGETTQTSQISPQTYQEAFRPFAEQGIPLLYLSLSGGLSNTYNSACLAAEELKEEFPNAEIVCVDSRGATAGIGLLLESAVKNRENGMSLAENRAWLEEKRNQVCHWFMVDDLQFLRRGGRVSAATAIVGTALNIKPILKIEDDGTLKNFAKARGTKAALNRLLELYEQNSAKEPGERIFTVHSDNEESAAYLEQRLKELNPSCNLSRILITPVIGAHTGPGLCAIVHFGNRNGNETKA